MMLVSIEPVRACVVDLHTFECAVCNQVLKTFAAICVSAAARQACPKQTQSTLFEHQPNRR
jgi:hypothetical protein